VADTKSRRPENIAGSYYVDSTCISCEACWKTAPNHFMSHPVETFAFVYRQPSTREEEKLCAAALKICPVQAIGTRRRIIKK